MKWIKLKRYCEVTGDTSDAVQKKVSRGIWREGTHIKTAPDGARWVNTEEVDAWVEKGTNGPRGPRTQQMA
jgi:hypothetical protein